ncbi:MAG TPA: hypothetical protein DCY25_12435 [Bacteroidales bacterium]|nr:hypothetical protein [Bacteroidales bacterium]
MVYRIRKDRLTAGHRILLQNVDPSIVSCEPSGSSAGVFIRFSSSGDFSEKGFKAGQIARIRRFASCHRTPTSCWMVPRIGSSESDITGETQFLLVERTDGLLVLIIPLIDGNFRCSLYGRETGLHLYAESGDPSTTIRSVLGLYILPGTDPYRMISEGMEEIRDRLGTFRLFREKKAPDFIQRIGWCSWNAFQDEVTKEKVAAVADRFFKNQIRLGFMLIDDGWQEARLLREPFSTRYPKFSKYLATFDADPEKFPGGLQALSSCLKREYGIQHILVWHTCTGYWCGADPASFPSYKIKERYLQVSSRYKGTPQGDSGNEEETVSLEFRGFYPRHFEAYPMGMAEEQMARFFYDYHHHLKSQGIDGVKVDAMTWVEGFGHGRNGRVQMMKSLLSALEDATSKW